MINKSRQKRFSGSEGTCDRDYSPSDANWDQIEKAYGHKLDSDTRAEVITLIKEYLLWEDFERNAPFVNDGIEWLKRLKKRGKAFYREVCFYAGESKQAAAAWHASIYIGRHLKQSRLGEADQFARLSEVDQFENLIGIMATFVNATRSAMKEIVDAPHGFVEGQAWDNLIIGLTNVMKARDLPVTASKGLDKTSDDKPSAFVRLVRALQNTFPESSRRHQITYAAAAQAISVARRRAQKRKTNGAGNQSRSSTF
jgi:hypothetical protein